LNLEAFSRVGKLGVDTAPLIYLVERHPTFGPLVRALVERAESGGLELISSTLTLTEVLSLPLERNDEATVSAYRSILLRSPYLHLRPIDLEVAEMAARLRALHRLKTPDALQVAVACQAGCEAFLTNDRTLRRVTEVNVLVVADLV
jgi:predicted nucleic acid-binding protein